MISFLVYLLSGIGICTLLTNIVLYFTHGECFGDYSNYKTVVWQGLVLLSIPYVNIFACSALSVFILCIICLEKKEILLDIFRRDIDH